MGYRMFSKYFSMAECVRSTTAWKLGIMNIPPDEIWPRIGLLMEKVMDPIREHFGVPITPNSVYRSRAVNAAVQGSATSQHMTGEACDFIVPGVSVRAVMRAILDLGLPFDQLIDEYGQWVHVSYTERRANRGEILEYRRVNGRVQKRYLKRGEV